VTANSYDSNGNTLVAAGNTFAYDSQDRMTKFNGGSVTMVYDGDGNRVAKSSGGVTTQYLVDDLNPTGLPQVAEEVVGGAVERRYVYGLDRISQTQAGTTSIYGYDAHGDVKYLMDGTGTVTDTYGYDAFGNLIGSTGTTPNVYRYQGEALDAETGVYYLRARYYDPVAGRFLTVDPLAAQGEHPYEYAGADPVNGHDPTGQQDLIEYTLLLWVSQPPRPPNVVFTCLGGKRQGGPMTFVLEWLGVCKVPAPPVPHHLPGAPYPSGPNRPQCNCTYYVRAHHLECRAYEWWGPVGQPFETDNVRAGNNNNPDYPRRRCVNNPDCEALSNVGPLPATDYRMGGDMVHHNTVRIQLNPMDPAEMDGRNGMQIHQDWPAVPDRTIGTNSRPASNGCIATRDYEGLRGYMQDMNCTRGVVRVVP
jgi:RHS repeat-associated protein